MPLCVAVVPCFEEARRMPVGEFERFLASRPPGLRLLFVDDGSRDATPDLLRSLARKHPDGAEVLVQPRNLGKGEAVRAGMRHALAEGADAVGYWDADLATPLRCLPDFAGLLAAHPGRDVILGSRVRLLGRVITRNPLRHYLGRVFATAVSLLLKLPVYDTQCGAKLFRRTPALEAALAEPFRSRWIFDVELLGRLLSHYRAQAPAREAEAFFEAPLPRWRDVGGSRLRPRDFLRAAPELWLLRREFRHLPPPLPGLHEEG